MRILHVVARSQRRGAETSALELAAELDRRGHRNEVVALRPAFDGGVVPDLPVLVTDPTAGTLRLVRALRRRVATEPPDLVMVHGGEPAAIATFPGSGVRQPVVWQRILGFPDGLWASARRRWWWRRVDRRCAAVVALTGDLAEEQRRLGRTGGLAVISNFRSAERFGAVDHEAAAASLRRELGVGEQVALIGLVGHLIHQKRPERAATVLAVVRASGIDAHLVVAGTGPGETQLRAALDRLDVAAHASFLGDRTDVAQVLGGLDVLILVSEAEGIPGVLIEAQLIGCPVVAVDVGGVAEVIEHGRTGLLVADAPAVGAGVVELLGDRAALDAMRPEARHRAQRFDVGVAADAYMSLIGPLVGGPAG